NIKTHRPKKGFHGKLNLALGSFSYINPSLRLSYGTDTFYGLAGYSYRYSKPYKTGEGKRFTEYANYKPSEIDSTAFSINTGWVKLGIRPSKDLSAELSYTAQRARDVLYPYLMMDSPKDDADRLSLKLKLGKLKVTAYYSHIYHRMNNSKRTSMMFMETIAKTTTFGGKAEYQLKNLTFGIEAFSWNWKARTQMGTTFQDTVPDVDFLNLGLFAELKKALSKRLKLVAGLRFDSTRTEADPRKANTERYYTYHNTRETSRTDTYPSGNIQLFYSLSRSKELFLGLGYSVRVPDAQERYFALNRSGMMETLYGDWVGNPNLRPSKNTELDLGLRWSTARFSGDMTLFFSYVRDYITLYNQSGVNNTGLGNYARSYANVDARFFGGELSGVLAVTDTLFITGGVSYVRGVKEEDPSRGIRDKDVAEIPPLRGRLSLRYDTGDRFFEVELIGSATQYNVDSDLREEKTPGWAVLNLKGGLDLGRFRLIAGADNVLDKFYYEHLSYLRDPFSSGVKVPEPGRSLYLNLVYTF
ncbi:MAG: TonB-dependent receptor, partial [Aquificota bacterium]|nr:TonB-dependent receptor [Aquificota bacterium]